MLGVSCCLHLLFMFLFTFLLSLLRLIILRCTRNGEPVHRDTSDINLASFAVAKGKSSMHRVVWYTNFSRPDIGSSARNDANKARMLPGTHHSIEHLIQRSITSITYNQVIVCFCCPGC